MNPIWHSAKTLVGAALLSASLWGCSSQALTTTEMLKLSMVGVFERTPDGAGNAEPKHIVFKLKGVDLIKDDGTTVDLWEGAEETEDRIISRSQIIFEHSIADYVGTTFTGLRMTFDDTVTGTGKYEAELPVTLPDSTPDYVKSLKVEKGKSLAVTISVQWKDIITRDTSASPPTETMTPPSLRFALEDE